MSEIIGGPRYPFVTAAFALAGFWRRALMMRRAVRRVRNLARACLPVNERSEDAFLSGETRAFPASELVSAYTKYRSAYTKYDHQTFIYGSRAHISDSCLQASKSRLTDVRARTAVPTLRTRMVFCTLSTPRRLVCVQTPGY